MNQLSDLVLTKPAGEGLLRFLLFCSFTLHIFFVLLLIGTAILSMYYFYETYLSKRAWILRWDEEMLRTFLVAKVLAVVLGVGPLLVIQLSYSVPFYTAVTMFGPLWMAVILIMIVAFIFIDGIGQKIEVKPIHHLVFGSIGLVLLLIVPGVFVTVLVTMEHPELWDTIVSRGYRLPGEIMLHWLLRYLHVLGAAVVFGAAFQYFISIKDDHQYRKQQLIRWIVVGMLFQFVVGSLLTYTLRFRTDTVTMIPLAIGVGAAALVVWAIHLREVNEERHKLGSLVFLLPIVLVGLLQTRQVIQQHQVLPLIRASEAQAAKYRETLAEYQPETIAIYTDSLNTVYDDGKTIYRGSCSFCHGADGSGISPQAASLFIPPEALAEVRADEEYLREILLHGVPGTGMPYFSIYIKPRLDSLIGHLQDTFNITGKPDPLPVVLNEETRAEADRYWETTCSLCHGTDGKPTEYSAPFSPGPPDLTRYSLQPGRAFNVITNGYPGTVMEPFRNLPEMQRWGLVRKVNSFR